MRDLLRRRVLVTALVCSLLLFVSGSAQAYSRKPDLTVAGAITTPKADASSSPLYNVTYNLGPTGLRGWIYIDRNNKGDEGLITDPSRRILITHVGTRTPAAGVLAVDDVILGVSWGSGGAAVPAFNRDCSKSLGLAIGEAEKAAHLGFLRLKRWRAGATADVQITLAVPGTNADTTTYDCPKSALILSNAIPILTAESLTGDDPESVVIPATSAGPVTSTPGSPSDHVSVAIPALGAKGFVRLKVSDAPCL